MLKQPVILIFEPDRDVLQALGLDLRARYGQQYRVIETHDSPGAQVQLEELRGRVALVVASDHSQHVNDVLQHAATLAPSARRVLLTNGTGEDAAPVTRGAGIETCVPSPWTPSDVHLYPAVDDLLADWQAANRPASEPVTLLGHRWSPHAHDLRDFLARNLVPYRWQDVTDRGRGRRLLDSLQLERARLPVVLLPDGAVVEQPTVPVLAERLGLDVHPGESFYDLAIIGGGPAGLAAAVYGASEGLRTVLVEKEAPGGQAGQSSRIENYLGFPEGLSGADLTRRASLQARKFGAEILSPQGVQRIELKGSYRCLTLDSGERFTCHAVVVAVGVEYRRLNAPGVEQLLGAGVYYGAATTEAPSCHNEEVAVVGGGNSAGQAALHFARYARRVVLMIRGDRLERSMSAYLIEQIHDTPNVEVRRHTEVTRAIGSDRLEALEVRRNDTGETETLAVTGLFILIGAAPRTKWLEGTVERSERGYILTGPDLSDDGSRPVDWPLERDPFLLESSVPGVFAVGDVRHGSVKRIASSVGEGAAAVAFVHRYLDEL